MYQRFSFRFTLLKGPPNLQPTSQYTFYELAIHNYSRQAFVPQRSVNMWPSRGCGIVLQTKLAHTALERRDVESNRSGNYSIAVAVV